jgi:hypothetical protein
MFPHFRRWIKVTAVDDPFFNAAIEASHVLYNFLALNGGDVLPQPSFRAEGMQCFRPSAPMLTSLETLPDATAVDMPALYDHQRISAALRAGHGKFTFSSDNEVLFLGDKVMGNGCVVIYY